MERISIKTTNGKFIHDNALTVRLLRLFKGEKIKHDGKCVTLVDLEVNKDRDYLIVSVGSIKDCEDDK